MDGVKIEFSDMLVEDENNAAVSYLDFTLHWHRCSPQLCAVLMMPFKLHRPLRCAQTDQYSAHDGRFDIGVVWIQRVDMVMIVVEHARA
ncbi:hypothetical protein BC629DRAFT_1510273 [Irpex lacteus]|nr:hypothetical protein BC629DRAFT_1510273 [Irpex lacteus]